MQLLNLKGPGTFKEVDDFVFDFDLFIVDALDVTFINKKVGVDVFQLGSLEHEGKIVIMGSCILPVFIGGER